MKEKMIYNDELITDAEMMVIEGLCLVNASSKKYPIFKRYSFFSERHLICKN